MKTTKEHIPGPRLRVYLRPDFAIGPGKADLLEGIRDTGSIAAAGRQMQMSYKRAWYLVDDMNRHFRTPVVETAKGGRDGGGAALTPLGEEVLERYRRMLALAEEAIAPDVSALQKSVAGNGA